MPVSFDANLNQKLFDQAVEDELLYSCLEITRGSNSKLTDEDLNSLNVDRNVNNAAIIDFFSHVQNSSRMSMYEEDEEMKQEPLSEEDFRAQAKDRQKKDNHNMIERRRRYNINDRIKELGTLLPRQNEPYYDVVRDVRQNKGSILRASVEYIKLLKQDQAAKVQLQKLCGVQQFRNRKLTSRIQEYEERMRTYGIPIESYSTEPGTSNLIKRTAVSLRGQRRIWEFFK
ncbi:transcription factor EC [Eurytemora carolleeae]|uniref:transcription factor EC n=1 Tax=Eurytemora carolleeae TaxID=1294199 RepID=UPI000C78037B|nr:transcription factor EC [Eurytemora carolleeae]|eukprot:XP_023338598.1 transcription factor EC-like [Eurytemora affinis]